MRCRTCEYPLWNLPARQCPECGAPFKPSDFDFAKQKVRFCCPNCDQQYFGTDQRGHLVPPQFNCVACGVPVSIDDMIVRQLAGVRDDDTTRQAVPWVDRKKHGFFAAWFKTIWMAMASPAELIRALPVERQSLRALWFAVMTNFLYLATAMIGFALLFGLIGIAMGGGGGAFVGFLSVLGFFTLLPILFFCVALLLWAVTAHALLRLTGRTALGFTRTFNALCYASAANVLVAIPCLGIYAQAVSWFWPAISAAIMLRETHKVSGLRATLAVFAFPLIICAAAAAFITLSLVPAFNHAITHAGGNIRQSIAATDTARAVLDFAQSHNGQPPRHAIELFATGRLGRDTLGIGGISSPADTIVNNIEIPLVLSLPSDERDAAIASVISTLPADPVAHRVGRIIFTFHGLTLPPAADPAPDLWLAVVLPRLPGEEYTIALASGGIRAFPTQDLTTELAQQNTLRATNNLPPLPEPDSVTVEHPQ